MPKIEIKRQARSCEQWSKPPDIEDRSYKRMTMDDMKTKIEAMVFRKIDINKPKQ